MDNINNVVVDHDEIKKAVKLLDDAYYWSINLGGVNRDTFDEFYLGDAGESYNRICSQIEETMRLTRDDMEKVRKRFQKYDETTIDDSDDSEDSEDPGNPEVPIIPTFSLISSIGTSISPNEGVTNLYRPILEGNPPEIVGPVSQIPVLVPLDDTVEVSPTQDITEVALDQLQTYLMNGDLAGALTCYKLLKALGKEEQAEALLRIYGYKVEERDGDYIITSIDEGGLDSSSETNTNTSNNNSEVVAEETTTPNNTNNENNQNQNATVVNTSNSNTNNGNYANSNNNNQNTIENTSTEVPNSDANTQVETPTVSDNTTSQPVKEPTKNNVVSITDDSETTTTKKSSGLGAAVPIGLGTIATGAAAVAGVRYVKNRHDNQEEYDENYDDENNNLDENDEYVDSAQYDNGSSYMDDDYLGPVDENNNLSEDSYVDPEDLEENDNFSDDVVLEDLNSNY